MNSIMKLGTFLAFTFLFSQNVLYCEGVGWDYRSQGPSTWAQNYDICDDDAQSPIDIVTDNAVVDNDLGPFTRSLFDARPTSMLLKNNGHSIQVDLTGGSQINDDSVLPGTFKAAQFHLHWGGVDAKGSEHTLNGNQYFGELHIVHYNTKYADLGEAASESDGLAVLGFFVKENYPQNNLEFDRVLSHISSGEVQFHNDDRAYTQLFSLEALMPPGSGAYYRYKGSLTTPPCYESVEWTVFEDPIRISTSQANVLRTMVYENERGATDNQTMTANYRPVQALNSRVVRKYDPTCSGQTSIFAKPVLHLVAIASAILAYLSL